MELKDERPIVVGIGEALFDCFQNTTTNTKEEIAPGGAPLIFAYHAAKSHCRGVIISAVGNDGIGSHLTEQVTKKGVIPVFNIVDNKNTGMVNVNNDNPNNPLYSIDEDTAWTEIQLSENELKEWAGKVAAVYFGSLASHCGEKTSKTTIDKFLKAVPKGCRKIFDVNLRCNPDENGKYTKALYSEDLIREYVNECNVLKANEDEIIYVGRIYGIVEKESDKKGNKEDSDTIGKKLMEQYCSNIEILILTKGEKGSTVFWRDKENAKTIYSQSIHISVKPKETVGAGDAMVGTFIGELLYGSTISDAHLIAARRADLVCKKGSMPEIKGTDFFFSYSKYDNAVVDLFYHKFTENKKYSAFKDTPDIIPGKKVGNVIADAIDNCKVFVYFSSETANRSNNVIWEINKAIEKNKEIIIIKLDDAPFPKEKELFKELEPICRETFDLYKNLHDPKYSMDTMYKQLDKIYNDIEKSINPSPTSNK